MTTTVRPLILDTIDDDDNNNNHNLEQHLLTNNSTSNCSSSDNKYEEIAQQLRSLLQCIQTLTSLMNKIGTERDSITVRNDVAKIKDTSFRLSKTIHLELADMRHAPSSSPRKNNRNVHNQRRKTLLKELEEEYNRLLARLQTVFNEIKTKESRYTIEDLQEKLEKSRLSKMTDPSPSDDTSDVRLNNQQQQQQQIQLQQQQQKGNSRLKLIEVTDDDLDLEEDRDMEDVETDLNDLVEIFDHLTDSVMEQETKAQVIADNVQDAAAAVHQGSGNLQKASKYAAVAGATIVGGLLGAVVGGPVGFVVGANIAIGAGVAVGTGVGVGLSLGAVAGFGGKKIADKVNSTNKKLKAPKPQLQDDSKVPVIDNGAQPEHI